MSSAIGGTAGTTSLLSFSPKSDPPGLDIIDHVEHRRCSIITDSPVSPQDVPTDEFYFPVDRGVAIDTTSLTLPHTMAVCVRNHAGLLIDEFTRGDSRTLPSDLYSIELPAPIKLYAVTESSPSLSVTADEVMISFDQATEVYVGARSHHKHPAGTITTTSDPKDMMQAISHFGSALKSLTPERSYPTLRGHPPTVELGDELAIPSVLEAPDTGITIEIPPNLESVFTVSSLAYYLGAKVTPSSNPRIRTTLGFEHSLNLNDSTFQTEVSRVLKQVFFLDCITRTEGYYPVELHERNVIEPTIDLDFSLLYEKSLPQQISEYLSVPYSHIESELPKWKLTAHIQSQPKNIELIPFIVNDLAVVHNGNNVLEEQTQDEFLASITEVSNNDFRRSTLTRSKNGSAQAPRLIQLPKVDSLEQTWIGDGAPVGSSKALIEAYDNYLKSSPRKGDVEILVVCNDESMDNERQSVNDIYGSRENLPFDVKYHQNISKEKLSELLTEDVDFFHYIGHINENGFQCTNGIFDVEEVKEVGIKSFLLNACTSYLQGLELVKKGSIAGIVTLQDVINSGAERIGKNIAKLLNLGFSLRSSILIAKTQSIMGENYLLIGDGTVDIVQSEKGIPYIFRIEKISEDDNPSYSVGMTTFPTSDRNIGSIIYPYFMSDNEEYYLVSSENMRASNMSTERLFNMISDTSAPIIYKNEIFWPDEQDITTVLK